MQQPLGRRLDDALRIVVVAALVGVVTLIDLFGLPRVDTAFFYFLPIMLAAAWFGDWGFLLVPAVMAIYHWNLASDLPPGAPYPYADDVVKLLSFALIGLLTVTARGRYLESRRSEHEQEILRADAETRGTRLEALYRVASAANASRGAEEFLTLLLEETRRLVPHVAVATVLERQDSMLVRRAVSGPVSAASLGERFPVGEGIAGRAAASGEPLVLEAADFGREAIRSPYIRALRPSSAAAVPLVAKGETTGVIVLFGDHEAHFAPEDVRLLQSMAAEAALVLGSLRLYDSLRQTNAELRERQDRLDEQLALARRVQAAIIAVCPEQCSVGPLRAASYHASALEVGGDLIRIVPHPGGAALFVGDVMGKGVPAALLMTMMTAELSSPNAPFTDAEAVLREANESLLANIASMDTAGFVTVFYAHISTTDLRMCYASAGHPPAVLAHANGEVEVLYAQNAPLGIFPGRDYAATEQQLVPGDRVVLYTDGLVEARDPSRGFYGVERLTALLASAHAGSAAEIRDRIVVDVQVFSAGQTQSDDIAVLVVGVEDPHSK